MSRRKKDEGVHEEVVNSLLDLFEGRARGKDPTNASVAVQSPPEPESKAGEADEPPDSEPASEMVSIEEGEIEVLVTPDPAGVETRNGFAPITLPTASSADDRISRLEDELSAFMSKVEQATDALAADRAARLEQELLQEVSSTRTEMLRAIDHWFARLEAAVADAKGEVTGRTIRGTPRTDEPA